MNNQNTYRPNHYSKDNYNQGSHDYKFINKQKRHREEENSYKYNNGSENHQHYKGPNIYSNKNYQKNMHQSEKYSNGKHYLQKREDNRSHSRERKDYYSEKHKKARYQDDHYERKHNAHNQSSSKDSLERVERGERSERMEREDRMERIERVERMDRGERMDKNERMDRMERLERNHSNFSTDRGRSYEDYKQKSSNFSEDGDYSKVMRKNGGSFDLGKESQHEKEDYHNRYKMYNSEGNSYEKYYGGSSSANMPNSGGNFNSSNNAGNIGGNPNKYEINKNGGETSGQSLQELLSDDGQKEVIKSSLFASRYPSKEAKEAMEPEEMIKKNSYNYDFSNNNSNNFSKNDNKLNNNINNYEYSSSLQSQKLPSQYNLHTFQNQQPQTGFSSGSLEGKANFYPNQSNPSKTYQNNLNNMNNLSSMNNLNYSSLNLKPNSSSGKFSNENFNNNDNDSSQMMQMDMDRVNVTPKSQSYQGKETPSIFSPALEIENQSFNDLKSESSAGDLGKKYYNKYNSHAGIQADYQKGNYFMKQGMSGYNYPNYNNLQGQYIKQGYGGGQVSGQNQIQGYGFYPSMQGSQGFQLQNNTSNNNFNANSNNAQLNTNPNAPNQNGNNAYNTNMYPNQYLINKPYQQQVMNNNSQAQMSQASKNTQVNIYLNNQFNKEFSREIQKSVNNRLPQEGSMTENNLNNLNNLNNSNNVNNLNSLNTNITNMNNLNNVSNISNFNALSSNLAVPKTKEIEEYPSIKIKTNILTTLVSTRNAENRKNFDHLLSEALNDTVINRENYQFSQLFKEEGDEKGKDITMDEVNSQQGVKERPQNQNKQEEDLEFFEATAPPVYYVEKNKTYTQEKLMKEKDLKTLKQEQNGVTKRRNGENLEIKKKKEAILRLELFSQILKTRQIEIHKKLEDILTEFM